MVCCVIQTNSWAKTVLKTTEWSATDFEIELLAPGQRQKTGKSIR